MLTKLNIYALNWFVLFARNDWGDQIEMRETYTTLPRRPRCSWEDSTNDMGVKAVDFGSLNWIHLAQEETSGGLLLTRR
jgi:hypothetical protein